MDLRRKVLINNISDVSNISRNGYDTANEDSSNSLYLSCVEDLENTLELQSPAKNKNTLLLSSASPLKERSINIHEIITTSTPMKQNALSNDNLSFEFLEDQTESDSNDTTVKATSEISQVVEVIPQVIPEIVVEPPTKDEPIKDENVEESGLKVEIAEVVAVEDEKAPNTEVINTVEKTLPVDEPLNLIQEIEIPTEAQIDIPISEKERHITIRKTFIPQKMVKDSVDFPITNAINPFTSGGFKKSTTKRLTIAATEKLAPVRSMPLRSMMPKVKEIVSVLVDKPRLPARKSVYAVRFQTMLSPAGLNDSFRRRGNLRRTLMPTVDNTQKTGDKRATLLQANKRKTINLIAKKVEEKKSVDLKIPIVKPAEPQRSEKRRSSSPVAAVEILKKTKAEPAKSRIAPVIVKPSTSKMVRNQCKYCDKIFHVQQALDSHYIRYCTKIPAAAQKKIMAENYKKERDTFTGLSEKRRTIFTLPAAPVSVNGSTRVPRVSATPKAHSGVYRTPMKTLKCTTCHKVFLDVLDFANDMQKHKLEQELKEAADKTKNQ